MIGGDGTLPENVGTEAEVDPALQSLRTISDEPAAAGRSLARRERIRLLVRSPTFLIGLFIVLVWLLCALFGKLVAPYPFDKTDILNKFKPPSSSHWFGTDDLGRDVFSRVLVGARGILIVATVATALGTIAGTAIGLLTGYRGGLVDEGVMRVLDAFLAIPVVVLAGLALAALGPSSFTVVIVIAVVFTPIIARTVRAAVLAEREQEYVAAAQLRHERGSYVMFVEILPNVSGPILVEFTVRVGFAIFTVATLTFLGLGIQPPSPDWGLQIAQEYIYLPAGFWWATLFPALAIASLVIAINLVSDGLARVFER